MREHGPDGPFLEAEVRIDQKEETCAAKYSRRLIYCCPEADVRPIGNYLDPFVRQAPEQLARSVG